MVHRKALIELPLNGLVSFVSLLVDVGALLKCVCLEVGKTFVNRMTPVMMVSACCLVLKRQLRRELSYLLAAYCIVANVNKNLLPRVLLINVSVCILALLIFSVEISFGRVSLDSDALDPPGALYVVIRLGFLVIEDYRAVIVLDQSLLG